MAHDELANMSAAIGEILASVETTGEDGALDGVKLLNIKDYPTTNFSSMPAAVYYPDDNDSDFDQQSSNERTYVFTIILIYGLELPDVTPEQAWATLRELYPRVLDAFDNSNDLNATCDILEPSTAGWGIDSINSGLAAIGTMKLRCKKTVEVTLGG